MADSRRNNPDTDPDLYEKNEILLTEARRRGDVKWGIVLSMASIGNEALNIETSIHKIVTTIGDHLEELSPDACLHFPIPESAELSELITEAYELSDHIEAFSSRSTRLFKAMAAHTQTNQ